MELGLFPLHTVLFPGRPLPLHVFEPRYRRLLSDCLDAERSFGVVAIRSGREVGGEADVYEVGTIARVDAVNRLEDGRSDVLTRGTQRFRIVEMLPGTPYLRARVELLEDRCRSNGELDGPLVMLRRLLVPYLSGLGAPAELLRQLPKDPEQLAWLAVCAAQVEVCEQQRLLELATTSERVNAALRILRRETGIIRHLGTVGSLKPAGPGGAELN